jgi:integrase/recombinase XerD
MPPRKGSHRREQRVIGDPGVKDGFFTWVQRHLEWLEVRNFSPRTVGNRKSYLAFLVDWLAVRGIARPHEVTKPILERYQRHLYYLRQRDGRPLSFRAQHQRLVAVRGFFKWLARQNAIQANPASEIELPRLPHRLPPPVLTHSEVEVVMDQPDLGSAVGLRDRAMLETFYSTGVRRSELANLHLVDLDAERGTLTIREGKGKRDRMVPIGDRAIHWVSKYLEDVRPGWALHPDEGVLFLSTLGEGLDVDWLSKIAKGYIQAADVGKTGACHAFRHAMATAMLDAGADIRSIQEILGHASLESTQVYTRVSIRRLQAIHAATHPGALLRDGAGAVKDAPAEDREDPAMSLLAELQAEAEDDPEDMG